MKIYNSAIYFTSKLILFFLIFFYIFPHHVQAIDLPIEENFSDNNVHDYLPLYWEEIQYPSAWRVDNGKYTGIVGPFDSESKSVAGDPYWQDYTFEFNITGNSGPDRTILYMYNPDNQFQYYWLKYWENDYFESLMVLVKQSGDVLATTNEYTSHVGETHNIKISLKDNNIRVFFDQKMVINAYDNDPIPYGKIGFEVMKSGIPGQANSVTVDDIKIYKNKKLSFNLPYNYLNRDDPSEPEFKTEFWDKMTASFDHDRTKNIYTPFTTQSFDNKDCPKNALGITCYDGHNGTDFRPSIPKANEDVYPVANGKVVYASEKDKNGRCNSEKSGYGCVIVMYHPDLDVYSLYAHLSEITKPISDTTVGFSESIGKMGNTGCYSCGVHIHLGVLKDNTPLETKKKMKTADWESLFIQAEPKSSNKINTSPKHYCTYKVPNGNILSFQDPSGWSDELTQDPWAFPSDMGGCGIDSPYLWMHNIGTVAIDVNLPKLWYSERLN